MNRPSCLRWATAVLAVIVGVLSVSFFTGCTAKLSYTIEAGGRLPDPFDLLGREGGAYVEGYDPTVTDRPGTHTLAVIDAEGKVYELTLTVRDTTEPVVTTKHVYYARNGRAPQAADFIQTIDEIDAYEAYFEGDPPTTDVLGDYDVVFRVKDASGNVSDACHSLMTVIEDTMAPVFDSVPPLSTHIGATVNYLQGVVVTDDCVGEVTVTVDQSAVDMTTEGIYPVIYKATDAMGNQSMAETTLRVYAFPVSEAQVQAAVARILQDETTDDMTPAQKIEAVHRYFLPTAWGAERPIELVGNAEHTDPTRAAYEALVGSKEADAFGCASVALAVCQSLGLDARLVERKPGVLLDEHWWVMVNIGTAKDPQWYHWDITPLRIQPANRGCLMTDDQLGSYNKQRPGFYVYDTEAHPASSKEAYEPSLQDED